MRDFVKVSQTIWKSKKFRSLPGDDERFCYLYLLTCTHANSAGCFDLPIDYISTDLKWIRPRCEAVIAALCEAGLIRYDTVETTVLIGNWFEFNSPSNARHAMGVLNNLRQVASETLKKICFEQLENIVIRKKFDKDQFVRSAFLESRELLFEGMLTKTKTKTETRLDQDLDETRLDLDTRKPREALRSALAEGPSGLALVVNTQPNVEQTASSSLLGVAKKIGAI
jgi:hypothetical protein